MFGFSNVSLTWSLADLHTAEEIEHSLICQSSFLVAHNTELLLASLAECGAKSLWCNCPGHTISMLHLQIYPFYKGGDWSQRT